MIDLHLHPNYSIDAEGSIDEFCEVAIKKKLQAICFTTHLDSSPGSNDCYVIVKGERVHSLSNDWLEDYESSIKKAQDTYAEFGLQVFLGVEMDLYPGVECHLPERFHNTEFDLVIGAVHRINGNAITLESEANEIFKKYDFRKLGECYYSLIIDSIETGLYDILGHIDIYRRYGEKYYGQKIHSLWKSHIIELAKNMKKHNVGFEINTSSWGKGLTEPMPEKALVRELVKRGIEDVTLGSDAHTPSQVGYGIEKAIQLVKNCGIEELTIYKRHKPVKIAA